MFGKIIKLEKFLRGHHFNSEASYLIKLCAPLVDIMDIEGSDVDIMDVELKSEEPVSIEYSEWEKNLKNIGSNIILIPFNHKKMSEEDILKLFSVFGISPDPRYKDNMRALRNQADIIFGHEHSEGNIEGDLSKLKELFPGLGASISSKVLELRSDDPEISEDKIVYILYNSVVFQGHHKLPDYLSHDLGHLFFDYKRRDSWTLEFDSITQTMLKDISKHYISSSGEKLFDILKTEGRWIEELDYSDPKNLDKMFGEEGFIPPEDFDNSAIDILLPYFFPTKTEKKYDIFSDMFTIIASGDEEIKIPGEIIIDADDYEIFAGMEGEEKSFWVSNKEAVSQILKKYISYMIERFKTDSPLKPYEGKVLIVS